VATKNLTPDEEHTGKPAQDLIEGNNRLLTVGDAWQTIELYNQHDLNAQMMLLYFARSYANTKGWNFEQALTWSMNIPTSWWTLFGSSLQVVVANMGSWYKTPADEILTRASQSAFVRREGIALALFRDVLTQKNPRIHAPGKTRERRR
jgi:hypothetical protein